MPGKGAHQLYIDDGVWGGLIIKSRTRKYRRVSDYLEPLLTEIVRLENEGQDPLEILTKVRKKKEV